jgi:hypothetical protein
MHYFPSPTIAMFVPMWQTIGRQTCRYGKNRLSRVALDLEREECAVDLWLSEARGPVLRCHGW